MMYTILLPIHPDYVKNIFNGTKRYEFRKRISNKRPQLYEVVAIIGELQGYEDYFLSNCLINNKEYLIYFYPQYITNALQEAIRLKKATNIYVYKKEKNILFYKLAAPKK